MGYYEPQESVVTVTQYWHVRVAARRYFNQAIAELKGRLRPEHTCIWKSSVTKFNGYQADLASFTIDSGRDSGCDSALDSAPATSYPDW